ncbi:MAG: DUF2157 domain-containing protein [Magnetococcales bacterium]|nr:DUF2157 domain-containing protein [Magnetococcales bacterium]
MANLHKKLDEWLAAGLLTPQQVDAIQTYEGERPASRWVYMAFLGLGALALGIGLISLVATNWEDIPDLVKLATAFSLLLLLALGTWHRLQRGEETLLVVFMFANLACLGLISQVYHTGGKLYDALLFWCGITFLSTLLSKGRFVPMLWLSLFISSWFFWLSETPIVAVRYRDDVVVSSLLALPYLCGWLAGLLFRQWDNGYGWALQKWALLAAIGVVAVVDVLLSNTDWHRNDYGVFLPAILLAMAALVYLTLQGRLTGIRRNLAMGVILLHLLQMVMELNVDRAPFLGFFFTEAIFSLAACLAVIMGHQRLFRLLILAVGLRIVVAYFHAAGGLAFTGFGLIFFGLLLMGAVSLWRRYARQLQGWLEELA